MLSLIHLIHCCTHLSLFQVIFTCVLGSYSSTSIIMAWWYFVQVRSAHPILLCSLSLYFTLGCTLSDVFSTCFFERTEEPFGQIPKNSILRFWDDWYQSINIGSISCLQEPVPRGALWALVSWALAAGVVGWPVVTFGCCLLVISTKNKRGRGRWGGGGAWSQDGTHPGMNPADSLTAWTLWASVFSAVKCS